MCAREKTFHKVASDEAPVLPWKGDCRSNLFRDLTPVLPAKEVCARPEGGHRVRVISAIRLTDQKIGPGTPLTIEMVREN